MKDYILKLKRGKLEISEIKGTDVKPNYADVKSKTKPTKSKRGPY